MRGSRSPSRGMLRGVEGNLFGSVAQVVRARP